jgi:AcrR family transcriptional regulator
MTPRTATARRARAHERARRDILESSARVFARRGYVAATLTELAAAAGYAPPSLYRYFRSKEEIFASLLAMVSDEFRSTFEEPVKPGLPLEARLSGLFQAQQRKAEAWGEIFDLLMAQGCADEHLRRYEANLEAWLRRNAVPGELRVPHAVAARAATGILLALRHGTRAGRVGTPTPETARIAAELILHGVSA